MSIPRYSADAAASGIATALGEAGCVVVTGAMDAELRQSITGELAPHMTNARLIEADDPARFYLPARGAYLPLSRALPALRTAW